MDRGAITLEGVRSDAIWIGHQGSPNKTSPQSEDTFALAQTLLLSDTDRQREDANAGCIFGSVDRCGGWSFPNVIDLTASQPNANGTRGQAPLHPRADGGRDPITV